MTIYNPEVNKFRRDVYFKDIIVNGTSDKIGSITLNDTTITMWPTGGSGFTTWSQIQGTNPYDNIALAQVLDDKADASDVTTLRTDLSTVSSDLDALTADLLNYVPTSRTINGHTLTTNINITQSDVGLSNVPNTDFTTPVSNLNADISNIASISGNWNSNYTTVQSNSANWETSVQNYDNVVFNTLSAYSVSAQSFVLNGSAISAWPTGGTGGGTWGTITGDLSAQTDLWSNLVTLSAATNTSSLSAIYAKLDGSNQPFTGSLNVSTTAAEIKLTDESTNYGRLIRTSTLNTLTLKNKSIGVAAGTEYTNPGGTGNRTSIITASDSGNVIQVGAVGNLVDGDKATNNTYFFNAITAAGKYLRFDFGVGASKVINEIKWYQSDIANCGVWKVQGSDDASSWVDIGTTFTLGTATTQTITQISANTTGYRYYQLIGVSGNLNWGTYIREIEFKIVDYVSPTASEKDVLTSYNGVNTGETQRISLGSYTGTTGSFNIHEGLSHNFNILGSSKAVLNSTALSQTVPHIITGSSDAVQQKIIANATQTSHILDVLASDGVTPYFNVIGNGYVGIGTTTPTGVLHVKAGSTLASTVLLERTGLTTDIAYTSLRATSTKTTNMGNGFGSLVSFAIQDDAGVVNTIGSIGAVRTGGSDTTGDIVFQPFDAAASTEKMRLTYDGKLAIGITAPTAKLHVVGNADAVQTKIIANATQTNDVFQILASDGTTVRLAQDTKGYVKIINSTGDSNIWIAGTLGVPSAATGNGNIVIGSGAGAVATSMGSSILIGYNAGSKFTTAGQQVCIGYEAGLFCTGLQNTNIGYRAGRGVTGTSTGIRNTFVGNQNGLKVLGGAENTSLGYNTFSSGTGLAGSYNTAIGALTMSSQPTECEGNTVLGYNAGRDISTGDYNIFIGSSAGKYQDTQSNLLIIDNTDRTNKANELTQALIVGTMAASPSAQNLTVNGVILPLQAPTATAPAYVKGGIYFDTTLNKLCVGGATTWEVISSV